jgi:adenylate cyclase
MAEARVQRRLAAILAADVVGYSRLMRADETETLAQLKALRKELIDPKITEYGGRIVKTTGDGILIEFPSAVDAVQHAIDVQTSMQPRNADLSQERRMEIRIGINVGDVIVEGDDLFGDGVNVAARLEGIAEPGGICISGNAYEQVRDKLQTRFEDLGEQQVKNIDRPVQAYRVSLDSNRPTKATGIEGGAASLSLSDKPSIAVLPFDNMSGDPEQEYFSDGMAEDLITDLSKISSLSVAARNSSFSFKGQMPDIKDVVEKLGVTFVLEGSVRKMGDRLRINAQLIDGTDGRHIWAERYDGNMAEIFEFQDAIREQIVSALQVSLTPTDKALTERKPTDSVEAYDLFLKGRADFYSATHEHTLEAIKCLEAAIEIDPNFADAYGYLSFCQFYGWFHMWPEFDDTLDRAYVLAERGVALDGASAIAVMRLGFTQAWLRRFDQAIPNFDKATALAPNNAEIHATFGQMLNYCGSPERGMEMIEKALRLETYAPPLWEFYLGSSYLLLHRYGEALTRFRRMTERAPKFSPAYFSLAWTYVELGRLDDAHDAINAALEINSQYTVKEVDRLYPYRIDQVRNRFLDSLRKAGLSEENEVLDEPIHPSDKPSIAVLPFDNMSGDPEQEYFSDGMAEDLITDISNISGLFVVARNSSFAFKGQAIDVKEVAAKLGVQHILEGSVRKMGTKLRVNAQLIDATSGGHIWAQRYDGDLENIFEFQDNIREQIVSALQVSLTPADRALAERKPTDSVEAYDLFLKGRAHLHIFTPEHFYEAIKYLEEAIDIDPNFADAHTYLSHCNFVGWVHTRPGFDEGLNRSNELAEKAVALDGSSALALVTLSYAQTILLRYDPAIANLEKAITLAANNAEIHAISGQVLNYLGNPERGLEMLEKAFSLEMFAPALWEFYAGVSHLLLRQYDEALSSFNRGIERAPKFTPAYPHLAWACVELGRLDDAHDAIKTVLELAPQFTVKKAAERWHYRVDEHSKRMRDSLRKAGLPEE